LILIVIAHVVDHRRTYMSTARSPAVIRQHIVLFLSCNFHLFVSLYLCLHVYSRPCL